MTLRRSRSAVSADRNPLHPKALTFAELVPELEILRFYRKHPSESAVIVSSPEQRAHDKRFPQVHWMVQVRIDGRKGKKVCEYWYLTDMGVTPYEHHFGFRWNPTHYTLAAADWHPRRWWHFWRSR